MNVIYTIITSFTNGEVGIGENNTLTRENISNCQIIRGGLHNCVKRLEARDRSIFTQSITFHWLWIWASRRSLFGEFEQEWKSSSPERICDRRRIFPNVFFFLRASLLVEFSVHVNRAQKRNKRMQLNLEPSFGFSNFANIFFPPNFRLPEFSGEFIKNAYVIKDHREQIFQIAIPR